MTNELDQTAGKLSDALRNAGYSIDQTLLGFEVRDGHTTTAVVLAEKQVLDVAQRQGRAGLDKLVAALRQQVETEIADQKREDGDETGRSEQAGGGDAEKGTG